MARIAVVTGASSGVGAEFVRQLAAGAGGPLDEIWAIARRKDRLEELAAECAVDVRPIAADLTKAESLAEISQLLEEEHPQVQWLVNSAGFGKFGDAREVSPDEMADMVRLNCLAVVEMCYRTLPHMIAGSRIVNLASVASFIPQPGLVAYSATKRFVLDFTQGIDYELGQVGIHACALCPKFMRTEFLDNPGEQSDVDHLTKIGFEDKSHAVASAIRAAVLGKSLCISSPDMRLAYVATKLLPYRLAIAAENLILSLRPA